MGGPSSPYAGDKLDCDIVMKGGITSGVVYPGAIAELAQAYRFRSIGGTSAGAIAAALLAAAEHRRTTRGDPSGFDALAALPAVLGDDEGTGELKLLRLFQPDAATHGLFMVLKAFLRHGRAGGALGIWLAFWDVASLLLLVAIAMLVLGLTGVIGPAVAIVVGVLALIGALVAPLVQLALGVVALKDNDFGLCTLGPRAIGDGPALTAWLHERIQAVAGLGPDDPPLTFADLWGVDPGEQDVERRIAAMLAPSADANLRTIDLQMMTTDLAHGRPRRLPSGWHVGQDGKSHLDDGGGLFYEVGDLERYFADDVLAHLTRRAKPISPENAARLPGRGERFATFPAGPDLPVVVATRMSLSFPGLISAVPLWEIDHDAPGHPARRVLFSDGGITSNFPVHFFDAPLPRRPTFGLNLTSLNGEPPVGVDRQAQAVGPLPRSSGPVPDPPREIASLGQFLTAIKDAMQNWRDNLQAQQPGFRDRMVPIRLGRKEGGMALTMDRDKIADLSARGGEAAKLLMQRFAATAGDGPHSGWNDHRFVRFRITMAATEAYMKGFERAWTAPPRGRSPGIGAAQASASMPYGERVLAGGREAPFPLTAGQQQDAARVADQYAATPLPSDHKPLADGAPRPRSVVRVVPPT